MRCAPKQADRLASLGGITSDEKSAGHTGRTAAQILLRWCVQRGTPVITKSAHRNRIAENAQIFEFELTADDLVELRRTRSFGRNSSGSRAQMVVTPRRPEAPSTRG
jgi:diketogulonate reductase-like aldo/keto reductase